jgi:sulfide:quinone oxidoreductase
LFSVQSNAKIAIVGAGPAGHAVAGQLARAKTFKPENIFLFDSRAEHHNQTAYTIVGGGLKGNANEMRKKENTYVVRNHTDILYKGISFRNETVNKINMPANEIETNKEKYKYDYLVICPGLSLRYDMIEGA